MAQHVIVGAGPVGRATASSLVAAGHEVRMVTRSGSGPADERIELVAADATDAGRLSALCQGAAALYDCANPPYDRWATDWPPLAAALLAAAERSGAGLVTMSNLYGYGPLDAPMTETTPLAATSPKGRIRAQMWADALAAHEAGRIRATEARASDFFGPGVAQSHLGEQAMPRLLAGKAVRALGDPDQPHSWTYVPDVGRTLATLGTDDRSWGHAWHVPSGPAIPLRQMLTEAAALAGLPAPKVKPTSDATLRVVGIVVPLLRQLREVLYQFDAPFILDATHTEATFGLAATPRAEALAATVAWWQAELVGESAPHGPTRRQAPPPVRATPAR